MWEENSPSRYKMSLLRRFLTQFTWRIHPTSSRHVVGFCLFGIYNINTVVDIRFWHCQMTHKIHINIKGGAHRDGTLPFSYILPLPSYIGIGPCPIHRNATLCTFRSESYHLHRYLNNSIRLHKLHLTWPAVEPAHARQCLSKLSIMK